MQITHISFSGGGMSGLANLGILRYMQMEKIDVGIQSIVGTSMGALFGCIMALGIPVGTLENDLKAFVAEPKNMFFEAADVMQMFHRMGIQNACMLTKLIEPYFLARWNTLDVTFLEFAKTTGKDLLICASCLETSEATYFSVNTTPNVHVLKAVQASMAIPLIFFPVEINGLRYVDGGITDNQPVDCFGEKAREHMLAVKFGFKPQEEPQKKKLDVMQNVMTYVSHLSFMMLRYWDRQYEKVKYTIHCDESPIEFLPCKYSKEGIYVKVTDQDIDASIAYGFRKAYELFELKQLSEPRPSEP